MNRPTTIARDPLALALCLLLAGIATPAFAADPACEDGDANTNQGVENTTSTWTGENATCGTFSSAYGVLNNAGGNASSAYGAGNEAIGAESNAFGNKNRTTGQSSSAFGRGENSAGAGLGFDL